MKPNQLFRNQFATCQRPHLRGKTLTLACEVIVGKRARAWQCEFNVEWVDIHGGKHITRMFDVIPEWDLEAIEEAA